MSGKYDLDRDLALRGLEIKTKQALSEDDVRQFISSAFVGFAELIRSNPDKDIATIASKLAELIKEAKQPASDTETPANQEASEVPAGEDNVPPWVERRKRPEPKLYK